MYIGLLQYELVSFQQFNNGNETKNQNKEERKNKMQTSQAIPTEKEFHQWIHLQKHSFRIEFRL